MSKKYLYYFSEGSQAFGGDKTAMRNTLGGKGSGLAEMTAAGMPVPQGFTITTEACTQYYTDGRQINAEIQADIFAHVKGLEEITGKKLGDVENPLLVSVRSGARQSMPGMMDTILNLGLNDASVEGLAKKTGNPRFAYDSYRRFVQMFADVVMGVSKSLFEEEIDKMKANIMESAWDGDWFLRAYDANGEKMGSKECEEGQIFIEPQGFAIMSDIGKDQGCDKKTLAAIDERLNTQHGLVLNNPAFTKYYIQYGEISTYPGGYKENAGIFTHNNAWIICAAAYAGAGDQAFKYYSEIAPAFTEETSDIHKTEPYVYGQMIGGKDAGSDIGKPGNHFGQGKNSWLTGTAAWNMVAISQYILGISADFDGLKIDPSIPAAWDGMTATRQFRGATYDIKVSNPDHINKGVKSVLVDGNAIEGNVIPAFGDGKTHSVEVVMG